MNSMSNQGDGFVCHYRPEMRGFVLFNLYDVPPGQEPDPDKKLFLNVEQVDAIIQAVHRAGGPLRYELPSDYDRQQANRAHEVTEAHLALIGKLIDKLPASG